MTEILEMMPQQEAIPRDQPESIRLIIWDLDETFWRGTLTEGGFVYRRDAHDIVISLARRGILSSICSKNDRAKVEKILRDEGIWDYFIFPSIDWSAKGPRVAGIINAVKLRAPTVLFIDDNPINLAEAQHFCIGIQVSDQNVIPNLLSNPLLIGRNDEGLSRLAQYKVLEQKHEDTKASGGDNIQFLRKSGIRVYIEHDIEANLGRAVELINRTNQLNFTKIRLSEDFNEGRQQLLNDLRGYDVNSGLVYATDQYGDYGCIGFYLLNHREGMGRRIRHFCFSCRTLGMEIETWLYGRLGKPQISIQGEVLTDLKNPKVEVDWISEVSSLTALAQDAPTIDRLETLIVRGGCDVRALEHYLEGMFNQTFEEMNDIVDGLGIRTDHSIFLKYAVDGISLDAIKALEPLGFRPRHFSSAIANLRQGHANVILLSLWSDGRMGLYRDRQTGAVAPMSLTGQRVRNLVEYDIPTLMTDITDERARLAAAYLRERFEFEGEITVDDYRTTVSKVLAAVSTDTLVLFLQTPTYWYKGETDEQFKLVREPVLNQVNLEVAAGKTNIKFLNPHDFAENRYEYLDFFHFTRPVYQRIGFSIRTMINDFFGAT